MNPRNPNQNPTASPALTRRGAMGGLATLLASGAWPGTLAAQQDAGGAPAPARPIRFVVVTDFHHENTDCDPWMEKLFRQIATTKDALFCFGLGDLANTGKRESLETIKRLSTLAEMPFYTCPGNHDLDLSPVDGRYEEIFPGQRNYLLRKAGWQFVVIDTTEGDKWREVTIQPATLQWLDETLPTLDPHAPTVLCTHFPLASEVRMCPFNAEAVLARFIGHNLRGVFGGHYHGRTSHPRGAIQLVTNACASRVRDNHDETPEKGYLIVDGAPDGRLTPSFVIFDAR